MNSETEKIRSKSPTEALTMRQVEALAKAWPDRYSVIVFEAEKDSGSWTVEIFFAGIETRHYGIETGRGEPKIWKTLLGAIEFVTKFFPDTAHVKISFRGWDFTYTKPEMDRG
ncbi:MAG: hypothetical protein V4857_14550 [Pseudomonadota bacterium]